MTYDDLRGRVVLISGAGGGLGRAVARDLAERHGAIVAATDISGLDQLSEGPGAERIHSYPADVRDAEVIEALPRQVQHDLGRLDGLVYAAGILRTTPLGHVPGEEWEHVMGVNLTGAMHLTQAAGLTMAENDGGSIVLISSVAARSGRPNSAHYAASKAGLVSLAHSASLAFAPRVRVNAILPGVFLTAMWDQIDRQNEAALGLEAANEHHRKTIDAIPLRRTGQPRELASAVSFLLSAESSYLTGQSINLDGGLERH